MIYHDLLILHEVNDYAKDCWDFPLQEKER